MSSSSSPALVCAPFYILLSEIPVYRSHVVDLKYSRATHCCNKCNLTGINNCPAEIHYGQCTSPPTKSLNPSLLPKLVNEHSVTVRSLPVSLPVPSTNSVLSNTISNSVLPTGTKLSRSIHHYKVSCNNNNNNNVSINTNTNINDSLSQDDSGVDCDSQKSFKTSVSATIVPKSKVIQDKSVSGDLQNHTTEINSSKAPDNTPVSNKLSEISKSQSKKTPNVSHTSLIEKSIPQPNSNTDVPKFFFPRGKPKSSEEVKTIIKQVNEKLKNLEVRPNSNANESIHKSKMDEVTKILKVPLYWKQLIFINSGGNDSNLYVSRENIIKMWEKIITSNHNETSKFFALITQDKKNYIEPQDFYPLVQDVLESHPGLTFLLSARDFHSRYIATVVYRIYFVVNTCWSGRITMQELDKSDLLSIISSLEQNDDINTVTQYFSYEHFYVIYCKFWELDEDHDLVISKADLARHNNYAISERMIERIFSGAVTKSRARTEGLMTYTEFVWFLLAEEDKRHPRSIEYWFRCMDLDGDGILSLYELEYFYQEQLFRMEEMGIEPISFEDCICQMLDMIKPKFSNKIRLSDLKGCRLVHIFFDTFFNLTKYLEHEQRDPFTNLKDLEDGLNEMSDWDRYAAEAYEILVAEDGSQENYNDNYRETNSYRANNDSTSNNNDQEDDAVYENINSPLASNTSQEYQPAVSSNNNINSNNIKNNTKKKSNDSAGYDSTKYNEYVNGKLADITDTSST